MVRIKDIAKEANVSEGTVDRVLHNRGGVSSKTEAKIKSILQKRNYSIHPVASALAMQNKYHIAILLPAYNEKDSFWKSPSLGILKASKEIQNIGIKVSEFKFDQYEPLSYLETFNILIKSKPDAVLLVPFFLNETRKITTKLEQYIIPYMFLNIDIEGFKNTAFIGQDAYTAGYMAGRFLHLAMPEKSTPLIIRFHPGNNNNNAISNRVHGFKAYFEQHGFTKEIPTLPIKRIDKPEETKEIINAILSKNNSIKGLFIPSSRISTIVECLSDLQLKELQMIGFDNTPQNIECLKNEKISFLISQKPFDQGYLSIRLIADLLTKNKKPNKKIFLPIDILTKENVVYNEMNQSMFEREISYDEQIPIS
jgi:LacI family transcriptional regulator